MKRHFVLVEERVMQQVDKELQDYKEFRMPRQWLGESFGNVNPHPEGLW